MLPVTQPSFLSYRLSTHYATTGSNHWSPRMQEQNKRLTNTNNNKFVKDLQQHKHVNPTSRHDMHDKTLALLNDRLQKGQISMEEFNKQCTQLGKLRNKN